MRDITISRTSIQYFAFEISHVIAYFLLDCWKYPGISVNLLERLKHFEI